MKFSQNFQTSMLVLLLFIRLLRGDERSPFSRSDPIISRLNNNLKNISKTLISNKLIEPTDNLVINRRNIRISIILPQDAMNLRSLRSCITKEMNKINSGNWKFLKHFYLDSYTYVIYKTYSDVMDTICSLLESQSSTAIFINYNDNSKLDELNSRLFLKFADLINLPVMAYLPNAYATNILKKNEIQLAPTLHHQAEAIMGILARYDWYRFSIIVTDFDSSSMEFLSAAQEFVNIPSYNKSFEILSTLKLKSLRASADATMLNIKKKLRMLSIQTRVIILHCHIEETEIIFKAASDLGLTTEEYIWVFTISVITSSPYVKFDYSKFPIGSLALWANTTTESVCDKVIHSSINSWANALENYYSSIDKRSVYTILPHTKCWNSSSFGQLEIMNDAKYHYGKAFYSYLLESKSWNNDGPMKFNKNGVLDSVELQIVNLNQHFIWKKIGVWNNRQMKIEDIVWPGLHPKPPLGRPTKFHLKIVTLEEAPFVIYKNTSFDGTCSTSSVLVRIANEKTEYLNLTNNYHYRCASGYYVDLIKELSNKLQFTFDIYESIDKSWGTKNKLGEWNGVINELIHKRADLAMTPVTITTSRSEVVDFSVPFMETGISIIVGLRPGKISMTSFLKPYNYLIWIMLLLVSIHSVAIAVYIFEWTINRYRNGPNSKRREFIKETYSNLLKRSKYEKKREHYHFREALWLVWVLFFRVATEAKQPQHFTSKMVINIWAILCLAFMASYTANLAAFMIIKEEFPNLNGVLDKRLTNPHAIKPAYRFGSISSGSTAEILKMTQPQMFEYMKQFNKKSVTEGITAVKEQKIDAFLYDAVILNYRAGLDVGCKLRVVGSWYSMTGYGIALTKNSKYKEMIDRKILEYIHSGALERIANYWFSGSCKNIKEDVNSDGVGIPQSLSLFYMLTSGIVLGLCLLSIHVFYDKHLVDWIKNLFGTQKNDDKPKEIVTCECDKVECQKEIDSLRKELIYFNKVFNSMKAIAHNPEPTSSFIKYNKHFLKNNRFASDHATHDLIVNMFETYINQKFKERSSTEPEHKSILKVTKNTVRFNDSDNPLDSQELQLIEKDCESNDEFNEDDGESFYRNRLKFETNV